MVLRAIINTSEAQSSDSNFLQLQSIRAGKIYTYHLLPKKKKKKNCKDFPGGPVVEICAPNAGAPGSMPGQGTRSHVPQLRPSNPV